MDRYNSKLESYRKAETWFDDPDVPQIEKEQYQPLLIAILNEAEAIIQELQLKGLQMSREQIRLGFAGDR
ncbi:MAG: hypothetical protein KGZ63_00735 [Clostridiales bacterium]|jgi:hypothetical protein|nr:hypothetical protein [Clostridiales bacterium]